MDTENIFFYGNLYILKDFKMLSLVTFVGVVW